MNRATVRACLATGPLMALVFAIGWIAGTRWIPVPGPSMSAEAVAALYVDHRVSYLIGFTLMVLAVPLLAPWGAALALISRSGERGQPVVAYAQLVLLSCCVAVFVTLYMPWALAAYRAGEVSAETTHTMHELGWIMFIFTVPPFALWIAVLAVGILWSPREEQLLPRWFAFYSLAEALMIAPAALIVFFKTGPLAYDGFLALWLPLVSFFVWMQVATVVAWRAVTRGAAVAPGAVDRRPTVVPVACLRPVGETRPLSTSAVDG